MPWYGRPDNPGKDVVTPAPQWGKDGLVGSVGSWGQWDRGWRLTGDRVVLYFYVFTTFYFSRCFEYVVLI